MNNNPVGMLKDALAAARAKASVLKESRRLFEEGRRQEFERRLAAAASATYGDAIASADLARAEAQAALDAAIEAEALAAERPIPLGTVMEEWNRGRCGLDAPRKTGRRGQLVLITRENIGYVGRGALGEVAIRLLKKDGTLGKTYVSGWRMDGWRAAPTAAPPADRTDTTDGAAAS